MYESQRKLDFSHDVCPELLLNTSEIALDMLDGALCFLRRNKNITHEELQSHSFLTFTGSIQDFTMAFEQNSTLFIDFTEIKHRKILLW